MGHLHDRCVYGRVIVTNHCFNNLRIGLYLNLLVDKGQNFSQIRVDYQCCKLDAQLANYSRLYPWHANLFGMIFEQVDDLREPLRLGRNEIATIICRQKVILQAN